MPPTVPPKPAAYRVLFGVSTRRIPSLDCEEWIAWRPGDVVAATDIPAHVPVADLVASGHLEEVQ